VYAPTSLIKQTGGSEFYGSLVGKDLKLSGNGGLHYDQALGANILEEAPLRSVMVQ